MTLPANKFSDDFDESEQDPITPWTAEQAQAWRQANPEPSLWQYWKTQMIVGGLLVGLVAVAQLMLHWSTGVLLSTAYGVGTVLLPSAAAVAGVLRGFRKREQWLGSSGGAGLGFATVMLWEGCKVLVTIMLLALAPWVLGGAINWLALVLAFVITLKAYWWAWMRGTLRTRK